MDESGLPETWEQMIDHLGYPDAARIVEKAVEVTVGDRNIKTRDLGGKASTKQIGKAVAELITTL